ncbi:hypothetical protein Pflav_081520 [Phytohabitans flavus]|uniref:FecR protein domain-containing protein n=1 Tax=Phytohabitans flavus TaxID=1076124 RepID=A0A6F8Y6J8_9ACTN|nr:hypothetical protein [Phytohabitans flavus]BCB81742.1 hypothetical protein Pflav_081520 [Phytohabitans flavus]
MILPAAHAALVIATGVVVLPDGTELRRGTMIGPMGHPMDEPVAYARTHVRLWTIPAVSGLPLLLGASPAGAAAEPTPVVQGQAAPATGVHPAADYPPLASPPGPPPPADEEVDRRFERRMWWLVLLFLLLAIGTGVANLIPGPAWAEMPGDKALLTAERGRVVATLDGRTVTLDKGDRLYVSEGSDIRVESRSAGRLTFRGGAALVLCAETRTDVGPLWSTGRRQVEPHGTLSLDSGRVLADTAATSGAFAALALQIGSDTSQVVNDGPAWYSVTSGDAVVSDGKVTVDGSPQPVTNRPLTCGDGVVVRPPAGTPSDSPSPSETLIPEATITPTPTPSATASPTEGDDPANPDDPADPTTPGVPPTTPGVPPTTPGVPRRRRAPPLVPRPANPRPTHRPPKRRLRETPRRRPCRSTPTRRASSAARTTPSPLLGPPKTTRATPVRSLSRDRGASAGSVARSPCPEAARDSRGASSCQRKLASRMRPRWSSLLRQRTSQRTRDPARIPLAVSPSSAEETWVLCWFCAKAARGGCRFCGRGICEDHARFGPFLLEVHRSESRRRAEGLVVEDALQCGTCRPRPQPIPMPELD